MTNQPADRRTIEYYERNGDSFASATLNASMADALGVFLNYVSRGGVVLDWGCGTGRDSRTILDSGRSVVAADASAKMCGLAESVAGIQLRCEGFLDLSDTSAFDGIWACASLLHLPKADLPEAFARARRALLEGGVIYASFKLGSFEGYRNGRWFTDLTEEEVPRVIGKGWDVLDVWISCDVRPGKKSEAWLNLIARKVG